MDTRSMLVPFLSQTLSTGPGPSVTKRCLAEGEVPSNREKNGRRRLQYWNIGHCVDELLTPNVNAVVLGIAQRPLA